MQGKDSEAQIRLWTSDKFVEMPADALAYIVDGRIGRIVLNRPEARNAMTESMWAKLPRIIDHASTDATIQAIVIEGAGTRAFCAGADIREFETVYQSHESTRSYNNLVRQAQLALEACRKPTVALIRGACIGGGCGLALACDIRYAAVGSQLGITPAKLGLAYSPPDTRRLIAAVGCSRAKDLLLSGRLLCASSALSYGLVHAVFPLDDIEGAVVHYLRSLAGNSSSAMAAIKTIINSECGLSNISNEDAETVFESTFSSRDFEIAYKAFISGNPVNFD